MYSYHSTTDFLLRRQLVHQNRGKTKMEWRSRQMLYNFAKASQHPFTFETIYLLSDICPRGRQWRGDCRFLTHQHTCKHHSSCHSILAGVSFRQQVAGLKTSNRTSSRMCSIRWYCNFHNAVIYFQEMFDIWFSEMDILLQKIDFTREQPILSGKLHKKGVSLYTFGLRLSNAVRLWHRLRCSGN